MNALVKDMSEDFEKSFRAAEDIKKLMQGVYATFIQKFGFTKMTVPSLDLDPQRTKLQLLVHQTEAFVKNPVNVFGKEKHFVVKNFYATLVKSSRQAYLDAKNQAERWSQAVVLPLEVQMKDHKAQLQSRLDNLARINEKTGSINEQMAKVKAQEAELRKQREMIEGLIQRVSEHEAKSSLSDSGLIPPRDPNESDDWMRDTKFNTAGMAAASDAQEMSRLKAAAARPAPAPKPAPAPAAALISDDFMSQIDGLKPGTAPERKPAATPAPASAQALVPAQAFDPEATQSFDPEATQKFPPGALDTQKMPVGAMDTQKMSASPSSTQRLPTDTMRLPGGAPAKPESEDEPTITVRVPKKP